MNLQQHLSNRDPASLALEQEVLRALSRLRASGRLADRRAEMSALLSVLSDRGYEVKICSALASLTQATDYLRNLRHEFLECTPLYPTPTQTRVGMGPGPDLSPMDGPLQETHSRLAREIDRATMHGGVSPIDSAVGRASDLFGPKTSPGKLFRAGAATEGPAAARCRYIVDPWFREQFEVIHRTPFFQRVLERIPAVFCGTMDLLKPLVEVLSTEMALAFEQKNLAIPPWRQGAAQLSKWKAAGRLSVDDPLLYGSGNSTPHGLSGHTPAGSSPASHKLPEKLASQGNTPRSIERGFCVSSRSVSEAARPMLQDASEDVLGRTALPPLPDLDALMSTGPAADAPRQLSDGVESESGDTLGSSPSPGSVKMSQLTSQVRRSVDLQVGQHTQSRFGIEAK